ncbi:hypothetical protein Tco_1419426 [Tanacetum coccineum]
MWCTGPIKMWKGVLHGLGDGGVSDVITIYGSDYDADAGGIHEKLVYSLGSGIVGAMIGVSVGITGVSELSRGGVITGVVSGISIRIVSKQVTVSKQIPRYPLMISERN